MKKIFLKLKTVYSNEGLLKTLKRGCSYILRNIRINTYKKLVFKIYKKKISSNLIDIILKGKYQRIVIWRGSLGWDMPMWQRPQQIAKSLANNNCLVLYEANRKLDKVSFFKSIENNLYLIDYELHSFENLLMDIIKKVNKPKYLQVYSTSWDITINFVEKYKKENFKVLYEYIDDLNPSLAGLNEIPRNVSDFHNYVVKDNDTLIVATADKLFNDICEKRGSDINIIKTSNGVEIEHFSNNNNKIECLEKIKKDFKIIIGYYGAIANWFNYNLVKKLAASYPRIAFVLIGYKYDNSLDNSELENYQNIFYLGTVSYKSLPDYARYFNIAWIPFIINDITLATSPIKLFEYMALGKFIVSSNLPECKKYKSVNIAHNLEEYKYYIDNYEKLNTKQYQKKLKEEALLNSWESKAKDIIRLFLESEKKYGKNK